MAPCNAGQNKIMGRIFRIFMHIRHYVGDLFAFWIGCIGSILCFGVLPILINRHLLPSLPLFFYILAAAYPLILLYAIRTLRLTGKLRATIERHEEFLKTQRETNAEQQQATSLLLHADAHLRSILSQRIHDQPKQQALRIRALLGYWQHKLSQEAEQTDDNRVAAQPLIDALQKIRKISEELEEDLRGLQLLVEDAYQRKSLGLRLHLEKLIYEDLPMLHPESTLKVQADLWALDVISPDREHTEEGEIIAEAISYTVTQALLNIYNHAGASSATVHTAYDHTMITVQITDNGHGFIINTQEPERTSLFKARLKVQAAHGQLDIVSTPRTHITASNDTADKSEDPQTGFGTQIVLRIPFSPAQQTPDRKEHEPASEKSL